MIDPIPTARNIVAETIELRDGQTVEPYVVWFCYILGGWKALLSTPIDDGRYYEVTYDRAKGSVYLDTYLKESNESIPDQALIDAVRAIVHPPQPEPEPAPEPEPEPEEVV